MILLMVILAIIFVSFLWKYSLLLSLVLLMTAVIKSKILPIKKQLVWYVISGFMGTGAESLIMRSGPWFYNRPEIFNFPVWLFFLWGLAGVLGISLYKEIVKD
jgi:hypothetical protein